MNKSYIGYEYFCSVCSTKFKMTDDLLDEVSLQHESGEELPLLICKCPSCESMSIPEGMNQIAWLTHIDGSEQ